uniref:uncharacterized protein LOC127065054 isoform X4 n=1 Tax=Vespula vulgaris TaxID=7454 RepID=UPI00223ADADF|nr:uncharacterized protein LOC127065054 isoform X4 [Vespula vulgaris]
MSLISGICNSLSTMPALYKSQFFDIDEEPSNSKCLFCENSFILPTNEKDFLTHLFKEHRVVIADVWKIASLKSYIRYWSNRFKEHPITDFCTTILMDCTPDGKPSKDESYFLLSDCISEDKALRDEVYKVKLKNYRYAKDIELSSESEDEELSWSDWNDESISIFCLFCNHSDKDFPTILQHIKEQHNFDFKEASKDLTFYQKVKLVNYIRVRIYMQCCILCEIKSDNILEHMTQQDHYKLPKQYIWDHPAFYFPMNENDSFLYNLDTDNDNSDESDIESTFKDLSITPDDNTNNYSDNNRLTKIRVEGLITTIAFHEARLYAEKLSQYLSQKYAVPQIRGMFQVDWYEYLRKMKVRVGGKMWALKRDVAVFINDVFIGSDIEFLEYLNELYVFHMPKDIGYYETHVKGYYKEFIKKTKEREPWIDVGENNMVHQYPYNTYSDISVWLNNVIDEIDIRDTASLLIAERYLSSLYCLSTDYLPEVNTYNLETDEEFYKSVDVDSKLNLCELLTDFWPEEMSKAEKEIFVKKLSKIIISYILNTVDHKSYALKDIYGSVHRILECAYDIARASIAKLLKQRINIKDASAEITKYAYLLNEKKYQQFANYLFLFLDNLRYSSKMIKKLLIRPWLLLRKY